MSSVIWLSILFGLLVVGIIWAVKRFQRHEKDTPVASGDDSGA